MAAARPGSAGEHELQSRFGEFKRAAAFYDKQMLDHLNPLMREYIARQEMAFIATADAHGECDSSFRSGPPGFIRVIDERTVMYPEYRGNGVMASLGNLAENGHVGILFVDFFHSAVGLHVNGRARMVDAEAVEAFAPILERVAGVDRLHPEVADRKKTPERWVVVEVVEAYIHCSKHIPLLRPLGDEGADSRASGDFFRAKHAPRPWTEEAAEPAVVEAAEPAEATAEAEPTDVPEPGAGLRASGDFFEHAPRHAEPAVVEAAEPVAEAEPTEVPEPPCELEPAVISETDAPALPADRPAPVPLDPVAGAEIAFDDEPDEIDGREVHADDEPPDAADGRDVEADDELEFMLPPRWGAYHF